MPPVKARPLDSWDEPTKRDAFARLMPRTVDQVTAVTRDAINEAGSHWARAEALFAEVEDMLK